MASGVNSNSAGKSAFIALESTPPTTPSSKRRCPNLGPHPSMPSRQLFAEVREVTVICCGTHPYPSTNPEVRVEGNRNQGWRVSLDGGPEHKLPVDGVYKVIKVRGEVTSVRQGTPPCCREFSMQSSGHFGCYS